MNTLLTTNQLCEKLNVSRRTIGRYVNDRQIPMVVLPGGMIRFDAAEIEKWLRTRVVTAKSKPII